MLIGAISDTHDNLPLIEKAVQTLNEQKVGLSAPCRRLRGWICYPKTCET